MGTAVRLLAKQFRFELLAATIAVLAVAVITVLIHAHVTSILPTEACLTSWQGPGQGITPGCENVQEYFNRLEHEAGQLTGAFILLPPILGAILGTILVARDLEGRTTQFAWSLSANRGRWLMERVLPVGIYFALLLLVLAVSAELLEATRTPFIDTRAAFVDYGQRGLPLIVRGLFVFSVGVLVGSIIGRQLPALILSTVAPLAMIYLLYPLFPYGAATAIVTQDSVGTGFNGYARDYEIKQVFRDSTGAIVDPGATGAFIDPNGQDVTLLWVIVPGTRLAEVELREAAIVGTGIALALGASFLVVRRRRPY